MALRVQSQVQLRPPDPACSVGWVRLRRGACGPVATAPKLQRVTVTTTTTTTVYEAEPEPEAEAEEVPEVFWRDDPQRNGARAHTWRAAADASWSRVCTHLFRWRELLSFSAHVLQCSQDRYLRGRIAVDYRPTAKEHARAIAGSRWQRPGAALGSGRTS